MHRVDIIRTMYVCQSASGLLIATFISSLTLFIKIFDKNELNSLLFKACPRGFSTYDIYRQGVTKYRSHSLSLQRICCVCWCHGISAKHCSSITHVATVVGWFYYGDILMPTPKGENSSEESIKNKALYIISAKRWSWIWFHCWSRK